MKQLGEKAKVEKANSSPVVVTVIMFPYSNVNIASFSPKTAPPSLFSINTLSLFPQTATCIARLTLVVVTINSLGTASGVFKGSWLMAWVAIFIL